MLKSHTRALLLAFALSGGAALTSLPATSHAEDVKVPVTADDHLALAKMYQDLAAEYRKEARRHEQMYEAYKKSVATSPKAPTPASVKKMQQHCQALAKDAEKLASDAEKAADYHALRAKELRGQ
jgi:hypothetical protein